MVLGHTKAEDGHLIIDPVQAEVVKRIYSGYQAYSGRYALSGMVFCTHCGNIFRRIKWKNRGCKSTGWRCASKVEKDGPHCKARTVHEEELQQDWKVRMDEMMSFLNVLTCELTEYEEQYVRTLIEKITVYRDCFIVEFKSGIEIQIDE